MGHLAAKALGGGNSEEVSFGIFFCKTNVKSESSERGEKRRREEGV